MITKIGKQTIVKFGQGTIVVAPDVKEDSGGTLTLSQCKPSIIGADVPKKNRIKDTQKVVLTFNSVESLDVVIDRLKSIRDDLKEMKNES